MKRLSTFSLFAMVIALFACNGKGGNDNDKQKELLDANRQVQRAIETGDTVILHKYIADDAIDHGGGPNGADAKGEEIVKMLAGVHNDIDNLKFETIQEAANDDHIFSMVRMTGTTNKAVWGMPAHYKIDSKSVDVIKVRDNKMVDHWAFVDPAEMMKMINPGGVHPADTSHTNLPKDSVKFPE
ncbi:MAG: SnoaL-like polyketide cyclase [Segetibacter sp.]|nr:SnoaL-like polyketide cyclase [Segetibacter sp.]